MAIIIPAQPGTTLLHCDILCITESDLERHQVIGWRFESDGDIPGEYSFWPITPTSARIEGVVDSEELLGIELPDGSVLDLAFEGSHFANVDQWLELRELDVAA